MKETITLSFSLHTHEITHSCIENKKCKRVMMHNRSLSLTIPIWRFYSRGSKVHFRLHAHFQAPFSEGCEETRRTKAKTELPRKFCLSCQPVLAGHSFSSHRIHTSRRTKKCQTAAAVRSLLTRLARTSPTAPDAARGKQLGAPRDYRLSSFCSVCDRCRDHTGKCHVCRGSSTCPNKWGSHLCNVSQSKMIAAVISFVDWFAYEIKTVL